MTRKVEITTAQLKAIIDLAEDNIAMLGCGENDAPTIKSLRLIDRFLDNNGISKIYEK